MKLWHFSDPHLSFVPAEQKHLARPSLLYSWHRLDNRSMTCAVVKRMDQRTWSRGLDNYEGYLERLLDFAKQNIQEDDILAITGDLTHDMPRAKALYCVEWLDRMLPGTKVVIRGNHDHEVDFGLLRATGMLSRTIMLEEGTCQSVGPFMFGCWSDHRQKTKGVDGFQGTFEESYGQLSDVVHQLSNLSGHRKKIPVMLSHYPVPRAIAEEIGLIVRAYLSGHVHCTNNSVEGGVDWSWYSKTAGQTDDQTIGQCFFSTGTTDVLLKRHGIAMKLIPIDTEIKKGRRPKLRRVPANPSPEVILMVGLPGSGKTKWCRDVYQDHIIVNQDELGSKDAAMETYEKALEQGQSIVVDRCNFNPQQRTFWIDLAKRYRARSIKAIWMDVDWTTCERRVLHRTGHQVIHDGIPAWRKQAIVQKFRELFVAPNYREGFTEVQCVRQDADGPEHASIHMMPDLDKLTQPAILKQEE